MHSVISGTMITEDCDMDSVDFEQTGFDLIEESKKADYKIGLLQK
jgi:hypothetical protein